MKTTKRKTASEIIACLLSSCERFIRCYALRLSTDDLTVNKEDQLQA